VDLKVGLHTAAKRKIPSPVPTGESNSGRPSRSLDTIQDELLLLQPYINFMKLIFPSLQKNVRSPRYYSVGAYICSAEFN
jgi:hypothetical protein